MNRKLDYRCLIMMQVFIVCLLIFGVGTTWAQKASKEFQETREEFFKALEKKPTPTFQVKGLFQKKGQLKGPAAIVPDNYDELAQNPIARSLILFDFDSDVVKKDSYPILQNLADVLKDELVDAKLVIAGHTDSVGTDEYNLGLSQRRAQAVKKVLVSVYTIDAERFILRWYGESQPLITENTKDARNRRVEFIRIE